MTQLDYDEAVRQYDAADQAYRQIQTSIKTPDHVRDQMEKKMIDAAIQLAEARQRKEHTMNKQQVDPKWGTTGGPDYPDHGNHRTYQTKKCRCQDCRRAWTDYYNAYCERRAADVENLPHGTNSCYCNYHCRCELCLDARHQFLANRRLEQRSAQSYLTKMRERGEAHV